MVSFCYWMSVSKYLTSRKSKILNTLNSEEKAQNIEEQPIYSMNRIKLFFLISNEGVSLKIKTHMNVLFLLILTHNSLNRLLLNYTIKTMNSTCKLVFNFSFWLLYQLFFIKHFFYDYMVLIANQFTCKVKKRTKTTTNTVEQGSSFYQRKVREKTNLPLKEKLNLL